jgi:hypothetical protein
MTPSTGPARTAPADGCSLVRIVNLSSLPILGNRPVYPVGAVSVATALAAAGHGVEIVDFVADPNKVTDLSWMDEPCDVVGFAVRDIDPIDIARFSFVPAFTKFAAEIRARADGAGYRPNYVGGGPGFTLFPHELGASLGTDCVISGEGEQALIQLLGRGPGRLGVMDAPVSAPDRDFAERQIEHPRRLVEAYLAAGFVEIGVETRRRKCIKKCQYCPYAFIAGNALGDFKSLGALRHTVQHLYEMGTRYVFFTDAVFNNELSAAKEVCKLLIELGLRDLRWSAYFVPSGFDEELVALVKASGNLRVIFSPDSFDPRMLSATGKLFNMKHIEHARRICADAELSTAWMLLFGSAQEDRATIERSAAFANDGFRAEEIDIHFGLRLLPGSPLVQRLGLAANRLLDPVFYPIDERTFDWTMAAFDKRFFDGNRMLRLRSVMRALRTMTKLPFKNPVDPHLGYLLAQERHIGLQRPRNGASRAARGDLDGARPDSVLERAIH